MEKYKYLIANSENDSPVFVILSPLSSFSHDELAKKLNLGEILSKGELNSTDPAFTLPTSEGIAQTLVNDLDPERYYTGSIQNFGFGHKIFIYIPSGDEYLFQRLISNLSSATLAGSDFKFGQAE